MVAALIPALETDHNVFHEARVPMSVTQDIQQSYKALVSTEPYAKITVARICEDAKVSKSTFYAHYSDKDSILKGVISDDIIQPIITLREIIPTQHYKSSHVIIMEKLCNTIYADGAFYTRLIKVEHGMLFIQTMNAGISTITSSILENHDLEDIEKDYTIHFFASGLSIILGRWLIRGMDIPPEQLAHYYNKWVIPYWISVTPDAGEWMRMEPHS